MQRRFPVILALLLPLATLWAASEGGFVEFHQGKLAFEAGNFRQAGQDFASAGRAGYPAAQVHVWMAKCYLKLQVMARALEQFERAREAGSTDPEISFEIARLALSQGELEKGRKELAALDPEWQEKPQVKILVAHLAITDFDFERAEAALRDAIPRFPGPALELIQALPEDRQGELAGLAEQYLEAAEAAPPPVRAPAAKPVARATAPAPAPAPKPAVVAQDQGPQPGDNFRTSGMTVFGNASAFTPKTGQGKSMVLQRWGTDRPARSGGGPFTLSRPKYNGATSGVGN